MFAKLRSMFSARPLAVSLCAALLLVGLYAGGARAVNQTVDLLFTSAPTAPVLSACGTSPAIVGNNMAGTVTMGTSATGCVITFSPAWAVAPICVVTWIATPLASQSYVTTTTAITTTQTSTSNNVLKYVCIGNAI